LSTRNRLFLAALLLPACERAPKTELERGASVYARACASCHGPDGRGTPLTQGLRVKPRDLSDPALYARLDDAALAQVVREGKGQMPAFGRLLPDEDVALVAKYVRSLASRR